MASESGRSSTFVWVSVGAAVAASAALFGADSPGAGARDDARPPAGAGSITAHPNADAAERSFSEGKRLVAAVFGREWDALRKSCKAIDQDSTLVTCPDTLDRHRIQVLIATIPDPHDSHLDWAYDNYLESFRRAFGAAGFVPNGFWLPSARDSVLLGKRKIPVHDVSPGVFLFRRGPAEDAELALLYLVPEIPTSGIHRGALRAAIYERDCILDEGKRLFRFDRRERERLRVIGPIFSGSSASVRAAIDEVLDLRDTATKVAVVLTGSATSPANRDALTDSSSVKVGWSRRADASERRIHFGSTVHSDATMERALKGAREALGLRPEQVIVLSESGTQYGLRDAVGADSASLVIPFPVNIASLRSVFERSGESVDPLRALAGSREPSRSRVSLDARPRPRENPQVLSALTTSTLDVVLAGLLGSIAEHDVRLVVIHATDIRDKLMLASEIRRRVRDVAIATFETNSLLLRPEFGTAFRGGLVFATYPLALETQYWSATSAVGAPTAQVTGRISAFPNDAAQGIYNATLRMLDSSDAKLIDYAVPRGIDEIGSGPGVWTSVIGRDGFYPLRVDAPNAAEAAYLGDADSSRARTGAVAGRYSHGHTGAGLGLSLLALIPFVALGGWVLLLRNRGELSLAASDGASGQHRMMVGGLLFCAVSMASLLLVLVESRDALLSSEWALRMRQWGRLDLYAAALVTLVVPGLALGLVVSGIASQPPQAAMSGSGGDRWSRLLRAVRYKAGSLAIAGSLVTFAIAVLLFSISIVALSLKGDLAASLYLQRATHFFSGVSPIVPLLLIGAVLSGWAWWFAGTTREFADPHVLEASILSLASKENAASSTFWTRAGAGLDRARRGMCDPFPDSRVWVTVAVLLALIALGWMRWTPTLEAVARPGALGTFAFQVALVTGLIALPTAAAWAVNRLYFTWQGLERFLDHWADTPIAAAIERLPAPLTQVSEIGLFGGARVEKREAYIRELLHRARRAEDRDVVESERTLSAPETVGAVRVEAIGLRLVEGWRSGHQSAKRAVPVFEEYFAMQIVCLVEPFLRQKQRLSVLALATLLVCALLGSSYPFQPESVFSLASMLLLFATITCVIHVMIRMNRNRLLCAMSRTKGGEITWDTGFVMNLVAFGIVPLIAFASAQFPMLRSVLFSWARPLLGLITKF